MPWFASILPDVAMGGAVVQDSAQVIFIISKNHHSTKPTVILNFSTPGLFQVFPTVKRWVTHLRVLHRSFTLVTT